MARPPRLENFTYTGRHSYFLTFCTYERQCLLSEAATVDLIRAQLLHSSQAHAVAVDTYCVMPDHVHLLVKGLTRNADLKGFMSHFKRQTGWQFRRSQHRRLWQGGYHDRVLRTEDEMVGLRGYIVDNPLQPRLFTTLCRKSSLLRTPRRTRDPGTAASATLPY